jgi:short-subunit dehydrogenase
MAKLVFITGASSGIGQALAMRYHDAGWQLALVARRAGEIQRWAQEQELDPQRYAIYGADVADTDSIVAAGQACIAGQGLPDAVIANAGISAGVDTARRADIDVLARTFAVNNVGMAATFHPIRGLPGHGAYCASKAAVVSYCESLRGELRSSGVRVVTICPGYVDTPLTRKNRYGMPFLMTAPDFAARAFRVIERGASYRVIPWQMAVVAKLLRLLPDPLFDRLLAGRPRKHRHDQA